MIRTVEYETKGLENNEAFEIDYDTEDGSIVELRQYSETFTAYIPLSMSHVNELQSSLKAFERLVSEDREEYFQDGGN